MPLKNLDSSMTLIDNYFAHRDNYLVEVQSKIYYRLHLFQLHFSYSYFISVTIKFQLPALFQLQLIDLKYFSY